MQRSAQYAASSSALGSGGWKVCGGPLWLQQNPEGFHAPGSPQSQHPPATDLPGKTRPQERSRKIRQSTPPVVRMRIADAEITSQAATSQIFSKPGPLTMNTFLKPILTKLWNTKTESACKF